MIRSVSINRFKSIKKLDLELGQVNLFIGGNGSGKSNILEAFGVVAAALKRGVTDVDLTAKGVRLTPASLMKSAFKNAELPKTFRIETVFESDSAYDVEFKSKNEGEQISFFTERGQFNGDRMFGRSGAGQRSLTTKISLPIDKYRSIWDQTKFATDYPAEFRADLDSLSSFCIYSPQTEFLRGMKTGRIDQPPVGLHGENLPAAVKELIMQTRPVKLNALSKNFEAASKEVEIARTAMDLVWLPGWTDKLNVSKLDPKFISRETPSFSDETLYFIDKHMHGTRNKLSAYDSSEGTLFLLFLAVLLAHREAPKMFAIDNIDNGLNPKLTRQLMAVILEITKEVSIHNSSVGPQQIWLTSHNPSILDAFDLFDNNQRVFVVSRNQYGHTIAKRLQPPPDSTREAWAIASKGRNLSELWINGEIAGSLGEAI
jgi:AAA15 family ATPase/GTPase